MQELFPGGSSMPSKEGNMQFVQIWHDGENNKSHPVDYPREILACPSEDWPVLLPEGETDHAVVGTKSQSSHLGVPRPNALNVKSGLPADVARYSAKGSSGFRNESDVMCLVRRPGQKYHDFSATQVGDEGPFARLFPEFAGVQRLAFEWGPQSQFPFSCRDCEMLRKLLPAFPPWRKQRQVHRSRLLSIYKVINGGVEAKPRSNFMDGNFDRDFENFLRSVSQGELPELTGDKVFSFSGNEFMPVHNARHDLTVFMEAIAKGELGELPDALTGDEVYRISKRDFEIYSINEFDADLKNPQCCAWSHRSSWFNTDLVRPLVLHHFPKLRELYVIDWNIRLREGAQIPASRQRFSGSGCQFVEVNERSDLDCWDLPPAHEDGGDVFRFAEITRRRWERDMWDFVANFQLYQSDYEYGVRASDLPDEDEDERTDPWRWRRDDEFVWKYPEDLPAAEVARLEELERLMNDEQLHVRVLACVRNAE